MRHAVCGMRQKRHISFLCEQIPSIRYALYVMRYGKMNRYIHAANLYEFRCSTGVDVLSETRRR